MLLLYCCMAVSGLFTLVFGGDIVFFIYLTSSQSVLCYYGKERRILIGPW